MPEGITEVRDFDIKYWVLRILGYWYYFLIAFIIAGVSAKIYLRYAESNYSVSASLLITDQSKSSEINLDLLSEFSGARRANSFGGMDADISILKSFDLIHKTLDSLNFQVSYYTKGSIRTREVYYNLPIQVVAQPYFDQTKDNIYIKFKGTQQYEVSLVEESKEENGSQKIWTCSFGEPCTSEEFSFITYLLDESNLPRLAYPFYIRINDLDRLTVQYINRVNAETRDQFPRAMSTGIVDISIVGNIVEKNTAFLNALSQSFINYQANEKNQIANNTITFINNQLQSITDSLSEAENKLEDYRAKEGIIDLSSKGALLLQKLTDFESQKALISLNTQYYDYLSDYLSTGFEDRQQVISPTTAGITDPSLGSLIVELNVLLSKRVELRLTEASKSPVLAGLNEQLNDIRERLLESIRNIKANSALALQQINNELESLKLEVERLPKNERDLLTIRRKFDINNELYTFLLKKKSESQITMAAAKPNVKVLDKARDLQAIFIGPISRKIYLLSFAVAFFLVLGALVLRFYFRNVVTDISQIVTEGDVSILASIPHMNSRRKEKISVVQSPKSPMAEAFRSIKLNLDFVITKTTSAKIVGITSATSGEGKTFCAINLSQVLALANKRTLLIGLDLRKPKLQTELNISGNIGLSNYLIKACSIDEAIQKSNLENLDIIVSGPIPPNPAELISNGELIKLLEATKDRYDYIIVDGPPIGLVTDYISVAPLMDTTLFVVRLNYSRNDTTSLLSYNRSIGSIKSSHVLVNDTNKGNSKYGYGYGYGYGYYGEDKPSFWSRLFKRK
jgi:capsular exopolysaccharide synthesis family protein